MYFDDFQSRLQKGPLPSLVLLFGDSEGVIAEGHQAVREKFRRENKDGSLQVLDGQDHSLTDVLAAAQTSSLFASSQLVVLQNAQKTFGGHSEGAVAQLKDYFENPNPSAVLVFLAPGMRKTVKAVAAMERLGWTVQCSDIPEWKMGEWIRKQAQARELQMGDEAAQLLVQKVGNDIAYLQKALDQLVLFVHPEKRVTVDQVRDLPVPGVESGIFQFVDAAANRQSEKALKLLSLLEDGVDAGTTILLYNRVRELLAVSIGRSQGWREMDVAQKLGMHPFRAKTLFEQSALFSPDELKEALKDLIHLQAGVVTGRLVKTVPKVVLENWILKWGKGRTAPGRAAR
ncbi:MAG TPA: DNA polymerase III subunit delta [bacterium]|nr:DNA polymerase III subunit delta [bacterium]